MTTTLAIPTGLSIQQLQDQFLSILPRIDTQARCYFRYLRHENPDKHEECVAETIAIAWKRCDRRQNSRHDPRHPIAPS